MFACGRAGRGRWDEGGLDLFQGVSASFALKMPVRILISLVLAASLGSLGVFAATSVAREPAHELGASSAATGDAAKRRCNTGSARKRRACRRARRCRAPRARRNAGGKRKRSTQRRRCHKPRKRRRDAERRPQTVPQTPVRAGSLQPNSADRMIFWVDCDDVLALSDAQLDIWKSRGVDGFACITGQIKGMGGSQDFTGDPGAPLSTSNYNLQKRFRDTNIAGRMRSRDMKLYLGVKLYNYFNDATPLKEWFDTTGWSNTVLPRMGDLAAGAKQLGLAGLAFDQEIYAGNATWDWNYPGNGHSEDEVRAKAKQRGEELMKAMVAAYPGLEVMAYDVELPQSWEELIQKEVNGQSNAFAARLDIDFWDGLSSVEGYGAIRLVDAVFYKTSHLGTWESAFQYQYNQLYSYLSRRFSNWNYASSRFNVTPFGWIDRGPCGCPFQEPRSTAYVAEQLTAFRKWGMGGEFANYAYGGLGGFDYEPYASAMRSASEPGVVDAEAPTLTVTSSRVNGGSHESLALDGSARDNLAIRDVRWQNDRGGAGVARLTWDITSGDYRSRYAWHMHWSIPAAAVHPGDNTISVTAEDIKGLQATTTLSVRGTGSNGTPTSGPNEPGAGSAPSARRRAASKARALRAKRRCLRRARSRKTRAGRRTARHRCVVRYRARLRRLRAAS